ncbi:hypothetical protein JCM3765_000669 [Sporobolomyces pararoseus]
MVGTQLNDPKFLRELLLESYQLSSQLYSLRSLDRRRTTGVVERLVMESSSTTSGSNTAGMQMRERRTRESSYHPMASDSEDGGVSDGDPPFYAGSSTIPQPIAPPPIAASLPTPAGYSPRPPNINTDSLAGVSGGASTALANPGKKGGNKRSFEELEDIVFSNPKSFATLAFAIAESRGVTLIVTDDRTHKVTSAYMHITCAFRKSGCPFILKLTKSKEGGWVLKGKAVDLKQRSVYRCRHPAGAVPEIPSAPPSAIVQVNPYYSGSTSSYPMSTSVEGGVSKPKAARPIRGASGGYDSFDQYESSIGKASNKVGGGSTRTTRNSLPPTANSTPSGARMTPITTLPPTSAADRALAPPFEPSPFERSQNLQAKIVPVLKGGEPSNGFSAPKGGTGGGGGGYDSAVNSPRNGGRRGSSYGEDTTESLLSTIPVIARSDPSALPEWTNLLRQLTESEDYPKSPPSDDEPRGRLEHRHVARMAAEAARPPSLVPLAQVLSHPYMSLTPSVFFAPKTTLEMKKEILSALPVEKVGVWTKVWAKKVLCSDEALMKWMEISAEENDQEILTHAGVMIKLNERYRTGWLNVTRCPDADGETMQIVEPEFNSSSKGGWTHDDEVSSRTAEVADIGEGHPYAKEVLNF